MSFFLNAQVFGSSNNQNNGGGSSSSQTYTLTKNSLTFTGGAGDDTFIARSYLNINDDKRYLDPRNIEINGGAGDDKLILDINGDVILGSTANVESLEIRSDAASVVSMFNAAATTALSVVDSQHAVTFKEFPVKPLSLLLKAVSDDATVTVHNSLLTGTEDEFTVTIQNVNNADTDVKIGPEPTVAETYEIYNLVSSGSSENKIKSLTTDSSATGLTLNIEGNKAITIDDVLDKFTTIDGSASTVAPTANGMNVKAGATATTFTGTPGKDTLTGGAGDDIFKYLATADLFSANAIVDSIAGGAGTADTISIGNPADVATGFTIGASDSWARAITVEKIDLNPAAYTAAMSVTLNANAAAAGIRTIDFSGDTSATGSNVIDAGLIASAAMTLTGSAGDDTITGGNGADTIDGGAGADTMTGGADADTFRFTAAADVTLGTPDVIADFGTGADILSFNGAVAPAFGLVGANTKAYFEGVTDAFAETDNVVVITTAAGSLSSADAAIAIGSATGNYASGDKVLFLVSDNTDSAVFLFTSAAADATVTAGELGAGPIITLSGVDSTELAGLATGNFVLTA